MTRKVTEAEIDEYIAAEAPYGFTGTRDDAKRYILQREYLWQTAPREVRSAQPTTYSDAYGVMRWSDTNERVSASQGGR